MSKKISLQLGLILLIIIGFLTITAWNIGNARIYNPGSGGNIAIGDGITSGTNGSLLFVGSGTLTQNNANLFWDNTNNRLGLGTTSPSQLLSVHGNALIAGTTTLANLTATGTIQMRSAATSTASLDSTLAGTGGCIELRTTVGQIIRVYATSTFVAGVPIPLYGELGACK